MALTLDYMKTRLTFNSNKTSGHVVENFPVGVFTLVIPSEPVALTRCPLAVHHGQDAAQRRHGGQVPGQAAGAASGARAEGDCR